MREIMFRGMAANRKKGRSYRTSYKNGDWVYGLLTDVENYAGFAEMTNTNGVSGIEVDKNTVGQFTGLTDKNGQQIFEGDILHFVTYGQEYRAPVVFSNGAFWIKCRFHDRIGRIVWEYKPEIIGNIHDNPELLEVTDNV